MEDSQTNCEDINSPVFPCTVSVVSATYNRSRMVVQAVMSAWQQTLKPYEIVVSDDCSKDDTIDRLIALKKEVPILKIITNSANSGGVPNWNRAVNASQGDLIAWCSDDDRFTPDHLQKAVQYLFDHPDVDVVHAGFIECTEYEDGSETEALSPLKSSHPIVVDKNNFLMYSAINFNWPFHPSTLVFRRKVWEEVGPFNPKFALADTEWFVRCAMKHRLVYLPYYGVINRRHLGSSENWSNRVGSVNMQRELYESILNFVDWARASREVKNIDPQFRKWLSRYRILLLRMCIARARAGVFPVARELACEITRVTPILSKIPVQIREWVTKYLYTFLNFIQKYCLGGQSKYANLGKHVPL